VTTLKVLVTGAAGRIGRNLCDALIAGGASVRGVVLPNYPGVERIQRAGVECIEGNLRDPDFCASVVHGCDAVMHLGAMLLFRKGEDDPALMEDNLRATFNVLHATATVAPDLKRFVFASSDEVYPSLHARYLPIDETHPTNPYSFYGVTKLTGEELVRYYQRAHGIPGAIARFALTIEPWESLRPDRPLGNFLHLKSMIEFVRGRNGEAAATRLEDMFDPSLEQLWIPRDDSGRPWIFHFCDVRDLVQGLLLLLEKSAAIGEAFNLSGPAPFSFAEVVPYVGDKMGRPVVEATVTGEPIRIHHSIAKASGLLGYAPKHDVFSTIDTAVAELAAK
jgi:UDP-glucose 4-epimerase